MHLKNNNFDEAEKLFKKAINESPDFGMPYKYLGDIKYLNRDLVKQLNIGKNIWNYLHMNLI